MPTMGRSRTPRSRNRCGRQIEHVGLAARDLLAQRRKADPHVVGKAERRGADQIEPVELLRAQRTATEPMFSSS